MNWEEYLHNLRQKPDSHKKRFAATLSGGVTAIIFLVWSFAHFGGAGTVVAEKVPDQKVAEVASPFKNIGGGFAAAWTSIKENFNKQKENIDGVDLESEYQKMKDDALNNQYGR